MTGAADVSTTPRAHVRGVRRPLGPWASFLIRRLARLVVSVWVLITFAFLLIHLIPGDPVRAALGLTAPPDLVERTREGLGLNDPLLVQYGRYMHNLFTGDFGVSMINRLPVIDTVSHRLPIPLGLGMAILTRDGRRRPLELGFTSSAMVIAAIPEFLAAVMLVYVFAVKTGWFPIAGKAGPNTFVLPVAALSIGAAAALSRLVRVEVLGVLGQDFIRTARSKRLRNARIYLRHALPNTLTATLTVSGLLLGQLVGAREHPLADRHRVVSDDGQRDPRPRLPDGADHRARLWRHGAVHQPRRRPRPGRPRPPLDDQAGLT